MDPFILVETIYQKYKRQHQVLQPRHGATQQIDRPFRPLKVRLRQSVGPTRLAYQVKQQMYDSGGNQTVTYRDRESRTNLWRSESPAKKHPLSESPPATLASNSRKIVEDEKVSGVRR